MEHLAKGRKTPILHFVPCEDLVERKVVDPDVPSGRGTGRRDHDFPENLVNGTLRKSRPESGFVAEPFLHREVSEGHHDLRPRGARGEGHEGVVAALGGTAASSGASASGWIGVGVRN